MAKNQGGGEYEHHVVGVRLRVTGSGNLQTALEDLDNVQVQSLANLAMQATTRFEPTRLANFQSQRIRFVLGVTEIDEYFLVRRIILYAKAVAVEYPM